MFYDTCGIQFTEAKHNIQQLTNTLVNRLEITIHKYIQKNTCIQI